MDKWKKLKDFLTDGKEHITKDVYVSRPSVFEEILDIMEELEKRESFELEQNKCNSCQNNTDELSGECYECVKGIEDWYEPIFDKNKSVKINGIETDFIIVNKNFIIEELEKIKDEILNLGFTGWADKPKLDREEVLTILDKHISELKGE